MRSIPRRSFGFSKAYLSVNLPRCEKWYYEAQSIEPNLWKPLPSIRTTTQVFGSSKSACSKALTYSYLQSFSNGLRTGKTEGFTLNWPFSGLIYHVVLVFLSLCWVPPQKAVSDSRMAELFVYLLATQTQRDQNLFATLEFPIGYWTSDFNSNTMSGITLHLRSEC